MTTELIEETEINNIYDNIKELVINARNKVYTTVNMKCLIYIGILVRLLWISKKGIKEHLM